MYKMTEEHKEEHKEVVGEKHHETAKKEYSFKISKPMLWKGLVAVLGILFVASIFTGGFRIGGSDTAKEAQAAQPRQAAPSNPSIDMEELIDDDTIKGNPNAPVTIVEWSDFECPFCTRFYEETLGQITKEYIDTGKVKLVYRDFPLGFHAQAQKAAEAAECAGEQGKFWEMHDALFDNGVSGGVTSFKSFAKDIGLNTEDFDECLDSGQMADEVKKDMADGQRVGITGTPGFIINGQLVTGAQPFENFRQVIEAELAK
jgi:protein-disulfide isomerase